MNVNLTWPTKHQWAVVGSHVVVGAGATIATLSFTGLLSGTDVATATDDVKRIAADVADFCGAVASLASIAMVVFSTVRSGPIGSFFRAAAAIASSPKLTEQAKTATLDEKAPAVAIVDKLPEVAGVGTTNTTAGRALATAVPSDSVQVAK
jgi:hypothetical protein